MQYGYWETDWLTSEQATTENLIRFVLRNDDRSLRAKEHRKRLRTITYSTWELYLSMPRIQTHLIFEQVKAEMWVWLNQQPRPVLPPGENAYQMFMRLMKERMMAKSIRMSTAHDRKKEQQEKMERFLLGKPDVETNTNTNGRLDERQFKRL